ncbi:hypothetical protein PanWU01x14_087900 [Parasponia andersonii]|uniref:Uncharacterized protein n=1 Tax=Parasponia andersonii TaxID=3476 RepID=A0A2P5D7S6_PARAD|nr:hypothetical protein PanWU01x14_087900 [Parasponia andersonii]
MHSLSQYSLFWLTKLHHVLHLQQQRLQASRYRCFLLSKIRNKTRDYGYNLVLKGEPSFSIHPWSLSCCCTMWMEGLNQGSMCSWFWEMKNFRSLQLNF